MKSGFQKQKPARGPKTSWEPVAEWYGRYMGLAGTLQKQVVFPNTLRLFRPKPGKRYLDIACGEGSFTRQLATIAHVAVMGFDVSPSLIDQAKKSAPKEVSYLVADATDFARRLPAQPFDGATCILAIQNIEDFTAVFREAARVLKPGAPLVVVMNHPCFRIPRQSGWGWDENRKLQFRRVDRYLTPLEIPILAHPGSSPSVQTVSYHRPLSTYVAALVAHGFCIDALEEWTSHKVSAPGGHSRAENLARTEIPLFLALRALKM